MHGARLIGSMALALTACRGDVKSVEMTGGETGDDTCGLAGARCTQIISQRDVDILLVIDNSASMAEEQARLTDGLVAFIAALESSDVRANYRIGITTTDAGNPRCLAETSPERGALVATSCLDRVAAGEFISPLVDVGGDMSAVCTERCPFAGDALALRPTPIDAAVGDEVRPWLESNYGVTNLPEGVTTTDALRCLAPQGVAGCGFESPLESMRLALDRARTPGEASYGFLRDYAHLAVIFVTDEVDCSYNPEHDAIFSDTNKVFWNDLGDLYPTSALCWRAGVTCTEAGPDLGECFPGDYNEYGAPTSDPEAAVLRPVAHYVEFVREIEAAKHALDPSLLVTVSVIAGAPLGSPEAPQVFTQVGDPGFLDDYGVDPGCVAADGGAAVPPVRLRALAEALDGAVTSICGDDFSGALVDVVDRIRPATRPACLPECAADSDPDTPLVQPTCTFEQVDTATDARVEIPPCAIEGEVATLPKGVQVCYVLRVDPDGQTATALDDMSELCVDEGWNVEVALIRDGPAPPGVQVSGSCEVAADPATSCPGL